MYAYPISINSVARVKGEKRVKPDHGRSLIARRAKLGLSLADFTGAVFTVLNGVVTVELNDA